VRVPSSFGMTTIPDTEAYDACGRAASSCKTKY
jgi:hypothetical protein